MGFAEFARFAGFARFSDVASDATCAVAALDPLPSISPAAAIDPNTRTPTPTTVANRGPLCAVLSVANKPPHPNAGKLLIEWLTSPAGQMAIQSTGRVPASPKVSPKYPDLNNFAKPFYVSVELRADFDKDSDFWKTTLGIK